MTREFPADLSYLKFKNLAGLPPLAEAAKKTSAGTALVLGATFEDDRAVALKSLQKTKELVPLFETLQKSATFKGKIDSSTTLLHHSQAFSDLANYAHLIAFGVGAPKECHAQHILSWGAKVAQELRREKISHADVWIDSLYQPANSAEADDAPRDFAGRPLMTGVPSREEFLEKFALGILLGLYTFERYKTGDKKKDAAYRPQIRLVSQNIDGRKAALILEKVHVLAEAVYLTRDLQTTPGIDMQPAEIARQAQQAGRAAGFSVTVWDEKKLKTENMNGILAVGMGSAAPPRFIIMELNAAKKNLPTVVFVGKGISFDTGGICIKPAPNMDEMKMDMSGSAAVIGALFALAKLEAPVHVIGLVASAENMLGDKAVRPGDIYAARDGQTVEILNTDAEGRLVLADALAYAHTLKPDCVIDIATLTGAVIIALGHVTSGLMGNNARLLEGVKRASAKAGERVWELPLYPEYGEEMKSKIADYKNLGNDRSAGSSKAGAFLNYFVKDAYPWAHLDVAGTADTPKGQGAHCPHDVGTAVPTRSLVEFALNFKDYFAAKKKERS